MRLDRIDLNLFVVFNVVYSELNLTRAAEVLHLSQPAVSNALGRLRKVFDDPLFVRHPRGMTPTPVADNSIAQVREALKLLQFSLDEGAVFDPAKTERAFRFSMNDLAESLFLPPLMDILQQQAPLSSAQSFYVGRKNLAIELASGQLDLAVDVPLLNEPNLIGVPLSSEPYVCVVRNDHPTIKRKLTMDQYLSARHLHVSSRRTGAGHIDEALSKKGQQRNIALRVQHYMVAPKIVECSDLLWTVPRNLAQGLGLKTVDLPINLSTLDWHLYWHKSADSDQANRWMREQLMSFFM